MTMASDAAIRAAQEALCCLVNNPDTLARKGHWSQLRDAQKGILLHRVVYPSNYEGKPVTATQQKEILEWIRANIGPECLKGCSGIKFEDDISWQLGCWDWFWAEPDEGQIEFMFLDPTDAIMFKLRWC